MKTIYHFDPMSGEFLSEGSADPSPMEPETWLIPGHATDIEPPIPGQHEVIVFQVGRWQVQPDWRGVPLWATRDGSQKTLAAIGLTPADVGATDQPRPSTAHVWQETDWVEDSEFKAQLLGGLKIRLCNEIDAAADQARREIGGDPLRIAEYQCATQESRAYRAIDFAGDPPLTVRAWAEAKGWSARAAAEDILRAANEWNVALYRLRELRLKAKEVVRAAVDEFSAQLVARTAIAELLAIVPTPELEVKAS